MRTSKKTKWVCNVMLFLFGLMWITPLLFVFMNVCKSRQEYNLGSLWLLPGSDTILKNLVENVRKLIAGNVISAMSVTFLYGIVGAGVAIIAAVLAAYGLTHLHIKHKFFWFVVIYSGTIFPFQIYLIPIFNVYQKIGLYNTRTGMLLFYSAICIPYSMFVFRNFFLGIDRELCEAARMEGAGEMMILMKIFMPMSVAPLSIVFLAQFTWIWNDLMFGLTFTKSEGIRPIMASLSVMSKGDPPALFLACIVSSVPTLLLFILLNKNFQKGFAYTAK